METFIFDEVAFKGPILHFKVKRPISIAGTVTYKKSKLFFSSLFCNYGNKKVMAPWMTNFQVLISHWSKVLSENFGHHHTSQPFSFPKWYDT